MLTLVFLGCLMVALAVAWSIHRPKAAPIVAAPDSAEPQRLKLSGSADEWCRVLDGETLLQSCHAQPTLDEILRQSRLAPEVFLRDLRPALVAYAEFVQLAPASESHHHAHPGGLLAHTLEAILAAMTLRNGYLLPLHAATETIDRQRDHWTFAVFLAALLHDIGKIMTDLRVQVRDAPKAPIRRWLPMSGALTRSRAAEYRIGFAPPAERDYAAHGRLALVLLHGIVPANALAFLGREPLVLEALTQYLGGAEAPPTAATPPPPKTLAQIVKQADQHSVAHNLQHGPRERFRSAMALPLIERLMGTLRTLLAQGTALPLNRDGAAGWVFEGAVWFVAKRLADTVRAALEKDEEGEGLPGPTKNDRLFDVWQDYGVIEVNPATKQAIWYAEVSGEGYRHRLAMLKFALSKLYDDPARYPAPMQGSVVPVARESGSEAVAGGDEDAAMPAATPMPETPIPPTAPAVIGGDGQPSVRESDGDVPIGPKASVILVGNTVPSGEQGIPAPRPPKPGKGGAAGAGAAPPEQPSSTPSTDKASPPEIAPDRPVDPPPSSSVVEDRLRSELLDDADGMPPRRPRKKRNSSPPLAPSRGLPVSPRAVVPKLPSDKEPTPLAIGFIEWVQQGLASGSLAYNEAGAPVHFIGLGMALVSPRIFREYAEASGADADAVQKQVIGAGWHVRAAGNSNILHFAVTKSDGARAGKLSAVVIAHPERWVNPLPPANPCLVPFELGGALAVGSKVG